MSGQVAALLLAAGKGRRMGCCKQLLPMGNGTVIGSCLETLMRSGIAEIVVVVASEGAEVAEAVRRYPVRIAVNPDSGGDMASSVRAGRAALSSEADRIVVALCDCPLVLPETLSRLISMSETCSGNIIIPCHGGRRGHPLLFPRTVLNELAAGGTLRDLVRSDPLRIKSLEVADPGILMDMDTWEDYRRILESLQSRGLVGGY